MSGPHKLLLLRGKVSAEELGPIRKHPGIPISDLDAREDIRGIFIELVLNRLADIGRDRSDVDEARYSIIDSRSGDDAALTRSRMCRSRRS